MCVYNQIVTAIAMRYDIYYNISNLVYDHYNTTCVSFGGSGFKRKKGLSFTARTTQ